jgi:hypothetical protein
LDERSTENHEARRRISHFAEEKVHIQDLVLINMEITPNDIKAVARDMLRKANSRVASCLERKVDKLWKAFFGTSPVVAADIWSRLDPRATVNPRSHLRHLLYAFVFLKVYGMEKMHGKIVGVDGETFRKWSWVFVDAISGLLDEVVSSV